HARRDLELAQERTGTRVEHCNELRALDRAGAQALAGRRFDARLLDGRRCGVRRPRVEVLVERGALGIYLGSAGTEEGEAEQGPQPLQAAAPSVRTQVSP